MSITRAVLYTRVKTRIRADLATPTVDDLDDNSITTWANEKLAQVIEMLKDPIHFTALVAIGTNLGSLTLFAGKKYAALPSSYLRAVAVKVGSTRRKCRLYFDPVEFSRFDSSNFVLTPNDNYPVALAADKIYVIPTSITTAYIDYIKSHPDLSGSQGTLFDGLGDEVLTLLVTAEYYKFGPQRHDLASLAVQEAVSIAGGGA